jgi:Na+/proline symporter
MLTWLDWSLIVAYLALSLAIGLWYAKRAGSSTSEFFLSGRDTSWWMAGLSMVATTFAADTPLAVTELTRQSGVAGNWLWWNMLLGGMLTTFFFARLWRRAGILTDLELITIRYSGPEARFLRGFRAVYLGLCMNAVIIGWVNLALAAILKVFFNLSNGQALLWIGGCMLLTTLYSSLSGLRGVIVTDAVQFCIAMGGCIVLAIVVVNSAQIGGLSGLVAQVPAGSLQFMPAVGGSSPQAGQALALGMGSFLAYAGVQWWASWYPGAEPGGGGYVAQRIMSAKTEGHGLAATLLFQLLNYAARPWPWILVALASAVLYPTLPVADFKLGYVYAIRDFLPSGLLGLLLVAFFAAYMSTLSTQLNWGTSYLLNDLYKPYLRPHATEKQLVLAARLLTVVMMGVSLAVTSQLESVAGAWQFLLECGAGVGGVLILRWYWWRINAWSEIAATVVPFVCMGVFRALFVYMDGAAAHSFFQFPNTFFLSVAITTAAWLAASYLLPGTQPDVLRTFYARVRPQGNWGPYADANLQTGHAPLWALATCWLAGISMVYALLFAIGKFLFLEFAQGAVLAAVAAVSAAALWRIARRYPIFD